MGPMYWCLMGDEGGQQASQNQKRSWRRKMGLPERMTAEVVGHVGRWRDGRLKQRQTGRRQTCLLEFGIVSAVVNSWCDRSGVGSATWFYL